MLEKIIESLTSPIADVLSDYVVFIDGVEYLPMDSFTEVYSASLELAIDVFDKIRIISCIEVCSIVALIAVVIFLINLFVGKRNN